MFTSLVLILLVLIGLSFWSGLVWGRRRSGGKFTFASKETVFAAHYSLILKPELDRPPRTYVVVRCRHCGVEVECPITTVLNWSGGKQSARVLLDNTNLEAHDLVHC